MKVLKSLGFVFAALAIFFFSQILMSLYGILPLYSSFGNDATVFLAITNLPPEAMETILNVALSDMVMGMTFVANMVTVGIFITLAFLLSKVGKSKTPMAEILSARRFPLSAVPVILVFGVALNAAIGLIWDMIPFPDVFLDEYEEISAGFSGNNLITFLAASISAPLAEEFLCRAIHIKEMKKSMPAVVAVVLSALIFGVMHGNLVQGSYAFTIGLIFGYLFIGYDSIFVTILLHFAFNSASYVFMLLDRLPDPFADIAYIAVACLTIPTMIFFVRQIRARRKTAEALTAA